MEKIKNGGEQLVDQMVVSPFRGMLTSWWNEKTRTMHFSKGNVKICTWAGKNPIQQRWFGAEQLVSSFAEKVGGKHGLTGVSSEKAAKMI